MKNWFEFYSEDRRRHTLTHPYWTTLCPLANRKSGFWSRDKIGEERCANHRLVKKTCDREETYSVLAWVLLSSWVVYFVWYVKCENIGDKVYISLWFALIDRTTLLLFPSISLRMNDLNFFLISFWKLEEEGWKKMKSLLSATNYAQSEQETVCRLVFSTLSMVSLNNLIEKSHCDGCYTIINENKINLCRRGIIYSSWA